MQEANTRPPLSRGRKLGCGLVTLVLAMLVALLLGEVVARIAAPNKEAPRWFILDKKYGYFHRKNFKQVYRYEHTNVTWLARFNELGLRGPNYGGPRPGERRVLCIGDSFTFGYGLDEEKIFPTKLERLLNAGTSGVWRVINAGVGGWGTVQETMYAREHFDLFRPDVVVLTVCDNDANDDRIFTQGHAGGLLPDFPGKRWLRDHSTLYGILYGAVANNLYQLALARTNAPAAAPDARAPRPYETNAVVLEKFYAPQRKNWQLTLDTIRKFHDDFLRYNPHGLMLVQMAQPYRFDLHYLLRSLCSENDIVFVDMIREALTMGEEKWLLPYDPHWTEPVQSLSAERLRDAIRDHYPVPSGPPS